MSCLSGFVLASVRHLSVAMLRLTHMHPLAHHYAGSEMMSQPYAHTADSYYFVEDTLVMHNKAYFNYMD